MKKPTQIPEKYYTQETSVDREPAEAAGAVLPAVLMPTAAIRTNSPRAAALRKARCGGTVRQNGKR